MKSALAILFTVFSYNALAQFTVNADIANVTCNAGNNGAATVSVTGGVPPYSFLWSDPAAQTTATASGLNAGAYTVLITDASGNDTLFPVTVGEPAPVQVSAVLVNPKCGAANGKITLNVSGGTSPFLFFWHHNSTSTTSEILTGASLGNYSLTVSDAMGCEKDTVIPLAEDECIVRGERVFTPNGDGINDTWSISNINFFPNSTVSVYNRWGQKVHEQTGMYEAWDGTHFGMQLPDATYYYVIYRDAANKDEGIDTGSVTIIR